ncbi:MAG: hypothetical protein ACI8SJ_000833 [Shewanella sp.]|jgi:hypothetical protein
MVNFYDPVGINKSVNLGTSLSVPYTIYVADFFVFKGRVKINRKYIDTEKALQMSISTDIKKAALRLLFKDV